MYRGENVINEDPCFGLGLDVGTVILSGISEVDNRRLDIIPLRQEKVTSTTSGENLTETLVILFGDTFLKIRHISLHDTTTVSPTVFDD